MWGICSKAVWIWPSQKGFWSMQFIVTSFSISRTIHRSISGTNRLYRCSRLQKQHSKRNCRCLAQNERNINMECQMLKACVPQDVLMYINLGQCWDCIEFLEIGKISKSERHSLSNLTQPLAAVIHLCQKELFTMVNYSAFSFCTDELWFVRSRLGTHCLLPLLFRTWLQITNRTRDGACELRG